MKERQVISVLIIKNCNLINMAGIYEEKKDLVVRDGKIYDICDDAVEKYHIGHISIDACGSFVTPGIVEPHSQLGVKEQIHRFEGNDADETTDPVLPQLRALDAVNPDDEGFRMALAGGVTTAVACPGDANLIGGTCAALKTAGRTVEDMVMVPELAFHLCLSDEVKSTYSGKQAPKTRMASAALIREALIKAKNYHDQWKASREDPQQKPPKFDMKLHSLMRVYDGMLVKFSALRSYDMMTAVRIAEEFGLNYTIDNCVEAWLIPEELKAHKTRCVIGPAYGGKRSSEFKNRDTIVGAVMEDHGIDFAISTGHPDVNIELSMVHLTMMHKKGLSRMAALEAATINAARFCGLDDRVGSLEPGKDADIVIWDGDPLDYYTSAATVLIKGSVVYQNKNREA